MFTWNTRLALKKVGNIVKKSRNKQDHRKNQWVLNPLNVMFISVTLIFIFAYIKLWIFFNM